VCRSLQQQLTQMGHQQQSLHAQVASQQQLAQHAIALAQRSQHSVSPASACAPAAAVAVGAVGAPAAAGPGSGHASPPQLPPSFVASGTAPMALSAGIGALQPGLTYASNAFCQPTPTHYPRTNPYAEACPPSAYSAAAPPAKMARLGGACGGGGMSSYAPMRQPSEYAYPLQPHASAGPTGQQPPPIAQAYFPPLKLVKSMSADSARAIGAQLSMVKDASWLSSAG
jgi:hypothetical protein